MNYKKTAHICHLIIAFCTGWIIGDIILSHVYNKATLIMAILACVSNIVRGIVHGLEEINNGRL